MQRWHLTFGLAAVALIAIAIAPRLQGALHPDPVVAAPPEPVATALPVHAPPPVARNEIEPPVPESLVAEIIVAPAPLAPPAPARAPRPQRPPEPDVHPIHTERPEPGVIPEVIEPSPLPELTEPVHVVEPTIPETLPDFWEGGCPACGMG